MNFPVTSRKLTAAQERELAVQRPHLVATGRTFRLRERAGSPAWRAWLASDARRTLIECNLRLALKIAGQVRDPRLGEERFGIAFEALCRAADGFDPGKGRFTTYAARAIRSALWRDKADEYLVIHVPGEVRDLIHCLDRGLPVRLRRPTLLAMVAPARAALAVARLHGPGDRADEAGSDIFRATQIPDHRECDPARIAERREAREAGR